MIENLIKLFSSIVVVLFVLLLALILEMKKPKKVSNIEKVAIALELTSKQKQLMGSWVEQIPEANNNFQGFTLHSDGTATSINTGDLLYKEWKIRGNEISLLVESRGLGIDSQDIQTYAFEHISSDTLLLKIGKSIFKYNRV